MRNLLTREYLKYGGTDINATAMTTATGTYYSDAIRPHYSTGEVGLLVKTSAGSLAVTYEVSDDGLTFYEPYGTTGDKVNTIAGALTEDTWVSFNPVVCEYMRIKFVLTAANSTVSAIYHQQEKA